MAEELYTTYMTGSLSLSGDGAWHHEGTPFTNIKLASLFHRSIQWDQELSQYVVRIGKGRATFDYAGTPFFVHALELDTKPPLVFFLHKPAEPFNPERLSFSETTPSGKNRFQYESESGETALLTRAAVQGLMPFIQDEETLLVQGQAVPFGAPGGSEKAH